MSTMTLSAKKFDAGKDRDDGRCHQSAAHSQIVFEREEVSLRRYALAQGFMHRIGVGASMLIGDAGLLEAVKVNELIEQDLAAHRLRFSVVGQNQFKQASGDKQ